MHAWSLCTHSFRFWKLSNKHGAHRDEPFMSVDTYLDICLSCMGKQYFEASTALYHVEFMVVSCTQAFKMTIALIVLTEFMHTHTMYTGLHDHHIAY